MGQGTSSDETGETEVMAINIGLLLAGSDQPGKPQVPLLATRGDEDQEGKEHPPRPCGPGGPRVDQSTRRLALKLFFLGHPSPCSGDSTGQVQTEQN